ncbi:hypothetical protein ACXZ1M_22370 [Duganella sp. PWIR1]
MLAFYFSQIQNQPGWAAFNVLVPVLLPFAVIAAVATATDGWHAFIRMLKKTVDQGQLFWVALSMLASAGYEAFSAYDRCPELKETISWTLGLCILGAFFSSIFIALNTSRTLREQRVRVIVVWISIVMAAIMSCYYPLLHAMLSEC